jgi:putative transposase
MFLLRRSYRYRLHPNVSQAHILDDWRRQCSRLYNAALEQRILWWQMCRKSATRFDQTAQLTDLRAADPVFSAVPVEVQRSALRRIDLAFQAFFRRCKSGEKPGFPRFRSHRRYDSFSIGRASLRKDRVHVPLLGHVKLNLHRPIEGTIKNVIIQRDTTGKWWIIFQCDVGNAPPKILIRTTVGIDVGLTTLATLSTGEKIENPRYFRQRQALLKKRQQSLARKQKGSKNRNRARILVAKTHAHVHHQRVDLTRKEAKQLVEQYDLISLEELNNKGLASGMFAKSVNDASWGLFRQAIACKAECAGKTIRLVDPRKTSQQCSRCGMIVPKTLADRVHRCPHCGLVLDRDHNAAINIDALGQSALEPKLFFGEEGKASVVLEARPKEALA